MTIQAHVSVYSQVFVPREYEVFAGLEVDHHSMAATFTDHDRLLQSLRLPYRAGQLPRTLSAAATGDCLGSRADGVSAIILGKATLIEFPNFIGIHLLMSSCLDDLSVLT